MIWKTLFCIYFIFVIDNFIKLNILTGISLIALLRMGLLKEMKERLYNLFLHLPLYEDMAPWNIGKVYKRVLIKNMFSWFSYIHSEILYS